MKATLPTPSECSMAGRAQQIWFISEAGGGHFQATIEETPATLAAPLKRIDGSYCLYWVLLSLSRCSLQKAFLSSAFT